ncbi:RNA polymerase sigma-70 factor [Labilithrix luteola]|uniref:RNA polymerase sigma-70 factor n=1 Tax=Labilithrix luteola TaxID=1391654 RepID=A0A0K1QBV3_9BACT|nr:RNA polymerase sigma factor [Labilithrix luteola]AKV03256.1 RNA polymerase sigma-70 factor [Labilithrix luteola]
MFTALMTTAAAAPAKAPERELETAALRPLVRAVVACVLREAADHPDVQDCTNEAMRRALESSATARGPLRPWLLGVARHVALDTLRARQKQRARNVDMPDDTASESQLAHRHVVERLVDPAAGADEQLELRERALRVRRVLASLPEGPRTALSLFHLEGLSYQEIAARLDVPLGTVATWVTRGRKAMAEALEDEVSEGKGGVRP